MALSRNARTASYLALIIFGMAGLTAASVPLYQLFCQVTGYGGTVQRADATAETDDAGDAVPTRMITVRFNADRAPDLPWRFQPVQRSVEAVTGEQHLAFYEATNTGTRPVVGTATYNVTPHKAGYYFSKLDCFCFTEQVLHPGETVDMPVSFFVDPEIIEDPDTADIHEITLSYTFFVDEEATRKLHEQLALARTDAAPDSGS